MRYAKGVTLARPSKPNRAKIRVPTINYPLIPDRKTFGR